MIGFYGLAFRLAKMYFILAAPFFIASFLAWNRVRGFLAPGRHLDFRPLFPHDPLFSTAHWLDAQNVTEIQFVVYTLVAGLFLSALGFFFDVMLRGRGFGALGNASLLLTGFLGAAWAWCVWAPLAYQGRLPSTVLVSALGGGFVLLVAVEIRNVLFEKLDAIGSGASGAGASRKPRARTAEDVIGRRAGKAGCGNFAGPRR